MPRHSACWPRLSARHPRRSRPVSDRERLDRARAPVRERHGVHRMELRRYALLLWRWLWLIVLGALLGGASAYGVSWQTAPVYESSTTLLINPARTGNGSSDYSSLLTSARLAKTYAELML